VSTNAGCNGANEDAVIGKRSPTVTTDAPVDGHEAQGMRATREVHSAR